MAFKKKGRKKRYEKRGPKKSVKTKIRYTSKVKIENGQVKHVPYFSIFFDSFHGNIEHNGKKQQDVWHYSLSFKGSPKTLVQDELAVMYMEDVLEGVGPDTDIDYEELKKVCGVKADEHFNRVLVAMQRLDSRGINVFKAHKFPLPFNTFENDGDKGQDGADDGAHAEHDETEPRTNEDEPRIEPEIQDEGGIIKGFLGIRGNRGRKE